MIPTMSFLAQPWRFFSTLAANNEATFAAVCRKFSFATLKVAGCQPGTADFARNAQRPTDVWRKAICGTRGLIHHTGCGPSQVRAKRIAEEALRLEET